MLILFAIRRTICFVDDHTKISARLKIELIHNWFLSLPSLPSKSTARFFGYLGGNMMSESLGARNFGGNHKFIFNLFLLEIHETFIKTVNFD
ncbi:unnamed protein product [Rhizophagus irregularis]|nr:unnamed protein product [Rhizophagus irregularis]